MPLVNLTNRTLNLMYFEEGEGGKSERKSGSLPPDPDVKIKGVQLVSFEGIVVPMEGSKVASLRFISPDEGPIQFPEPKEGTLYIVGPGVGYHPSVRGRKDILIATSTRVAEDDPTVYDLLLYPYDTGRSEPLLYRELDRWEPAFVNDY